MRENHRLRNNKDKSSDGIYTLKDMSMLSCETLNVA